MASKLIIEPKCPLCGDMVYYPIKRGAKRPENAEYIQTRRGRKQLLHTDCFNKMIKENRSWYD